MKKKIIGFKLSSYQSLKSTNWANPVILKNGIKELEIVSIDQDSILYQNYPILLSDGTRCSLNGKNPEGNELRISHDPKSPFIDGRLVSDKTFALRFLGFLDKIQVNDVCGEEELEYLKLVARELLDWQISTVTSEEEKDYFQNNNIKI